MDKIFKSFFISKKYINKKFLIAVSGGVDSMVILYIFNKILNKNISVCTCNFNLNNTYKNNLLVFNFCYKNKINFFFKKFNTLKYIKKTKKSIQMGARELRYAWFNKIIKKYNYNYLITAHHFDDNIETFFINLLRGSSIYGLKGIKSVNKNIIRPYLIFKINKDEIFKYAFKKKIYWINDKSNFTNIYLRNQIRNNIIPILKKEFNNFYTYIKNSLIKLHFEYEIINRYINKIKKKFFGFKQILNIKYKCIYINSFINIKNYEYILYRLLIKYKFYNINILKRIFLLNVGKKIYSNDNKYKIIKLRNKIILTKNSIIKIYKKISFPKKIYVNNNSKIYFFLKKNKKKYYKKKYIYINYDIINRPIYIKNWEKGDSFYNNEQKIKINNIFKKFKITSFYKDKILFLVDKKNNILCSLNKVFIYNNLYLINKKTKKILFFNFLK
ncbi:MAG: tRNA lysidine(34) synthetase TilS [Candidatus Shikimatogenerans bostrichidophilus]|nr:MAG: tRNA lysidine(34) synthetase TilS [Candidatus Shikimatogenerans bostrichidophilus]